MNEINDTPSPIIFDYKKPYFLVNPKYKIYLSEQLGKTTEEINDIVDFINNGLKERNLI